ncbi:MAG: SAM-dependent chlorinase/fluorinase [Bacteroidales bacterium]
MPIITLISDWSKQDYYLAMVKASILSKSQGIQIVDISHQVNPFNLSQAAFILQNCWKRFPSGTIHLICVTTESTTERPVLCFEVSGQYFIMADNGISGILFEEPPVQVVRIDKWKSTSAFPVPDVFVPAAVHLAQGGAIRELGSLVNEWNRLSPIVPVVDDAVIMGSVVYIDSYRNAITNITREMFDKTGKGRPFEIFVQSNHYRITRINTGYSETTSGELLALFNSSGLLEIAICNGNASELLNLDTRSVVRVKFLK